VWRRPLLIYVAFALATAPFAFADFNYDLTRDWATPGDLAGSKVLWGSLWIVTAFPIVAASVLMRHSGQTAGRSLAVLLGIAVIFAATVEMHLRLMRLGAEFYERRGLHVFPGEHGMAVLVILLAESAIYAIAFLALSVYVLLKFRSAHSELV
jgi:hypothetical protein